jgi:hypothetical protein
MREFQQFFEQNRGAVRKQRKSIEDALSSSPATVTELAAKTQLTKKLIVWNIIGMLKWGNVEVKGHQNDELIYALKEA